MFNFFKSKFTSTSDNPDADSLVQEFARQDPRNYSHRLEDFTAGVKYKKAEPQFQRDVVFAMLNWLEKNSPSIFNSQTTDNWMLQWKMRGIFLHMLRHKLSFSEQDVIALLQWSVRENENHTYSHGIPQMIKVLGDHLKENELSTDLTRAIDNLIKVIESENRGVEAPRWVLRLKELKGDTEISLPLSAEDVWAAVALRDLRSLDPKVQTPWAELLLNCLRTTGSAPSSKWLKGTDKYLETIGKQEFFGTLLNWFPRMDEPRPATSVQHLPSYHLMQVNTDVLKGLVWLCSKTDNPEVARALAMLAVSAYKKIPGSGPRAGKVGNACFWALGNMPGSEGVAQLSILKLRVKTNTAQKLIANALETAARRIGLTAEEIEEMAVPTYGLEEVGLRRDELDEICSELRISGNEVEQFWARKDGKHLTSAPKTLKEKYPEKLREIAQAAKDIRKMLPAQRDRLDSLVLLQKKWTYESWLKRYIRHPLVGTVARRLIWRFVKGDRAASAIWFDGRMVERDGKPVNWLDETTTVELWHPIYAEPNVVIEWRQWLMDHEIRQPFKQAFREI